VWHQQDTTIGNQGDTGGDTNRFAAHARTTGQARDAISEHNMLKLSKHSQISTRKT
jgi:hypothetical protein